MPENKLQIRAKLLSAIINLQSNSNDSNYIKTTLEELKRIEDKDAVLEILTKELLKENAEMKDLTITFLLRELVDEEKIEKHFFEALAMPLIKDSLKTKLIGVLRAGGKHVNYEQYITYFENPDEIIDADTTKLLENAKVNPESQIDFMDFINALPTQEQEMLIVSLTKDYDGDNLANILIPVILSNPYSTLAQGSIRAIGESKSFLAYPVLKYLEERVDDLKVKLIIQKSLSLLRLTGIKEDITKEYYQKLFEKIPVHKCFANLPDGHGNVGIIFSRKHPNGLITTFTVVINDTDGIIDCFGFNEIAESEFDRITSRFFNNDRVIEIDPKLVKFLLVNAEKISRLKYKEISYEFVAWNTITYDLDYEEIKFEEALESSAPSEFLLKLLYDNGFFEKWFLERNDNEEFAAMTEAVEESAPESIEALETFVFEFKDRIFSVDELEKLNKRMVLTAYFSKLDGENEFSKAIYSLVSGSEMKNTFLTDVIKKSLYEYFLLQKEKFNSTKSAASIFARRANKDAEKIDIKFVEKMIKEIEKNWAK